MTITLHKFIIHNRTKMGKDDHDLLCEDTVDSEEEVDTDEDDD